MNTQLKKKNCSEISHMPIKMAKLKHTDNTKLRI